MSAMLYPQSRLKPSMTLTERLIRKAAVSDAGCWLFQGATTRQGYGQIRWNGRLSYIHRLAYEAFVAPIPAGMQIDHLCRVRRCFNPEHLEPVTCGENIRRGWAARRAEQAAS